MGTQPDGRLVRRHGVRALAELEPLYRAEYANLVRSLTVLAGSREAAADAVQDAFVAAGIRWREVSAMEKPVGWIRVVAARRLLDGRRRAERWRRLVPVVGRDVPRATEQRAADHDEVMAAMSRLPARQRAVVALHYVEDWPIADVAAALGVAPGTVKSTLFDARAALRVALTEGASDV